MGDDDVIRTPARITYDSVEAYQEKDKEVIDIIVADTGRLPLSTKSMPPQHFGFAVTDPALKKLKAIGCGVNVIVDTE